MSNAPTQLLNFHDAQLYTSDVPLFLSPCWLNDNCLFFYQTYFHHIRLGTNDASPFYFMHPIIVNWLMTLSHEDFQEEYHNAILSQKNSEKVKFLFFPLNDRNSSTAFGTHWSILIYDIKGRILSHYDFSILKLEYVQIKFMAINKEKSCL